MLTNKRRAIRLAAAVTITAAFAAAFATNTIAADKSAMTTPTSAASMSKVTYARLYPGADGVSHFATEELVFSASGGQGAEAALGVNRLGDVKGAMFARLKAGATEDWHVAPRRQLMICIRGIVEVTAGDGEKRRVMPGEFLLLEDLTGKGHVTHSAGTEDHVALAIPVPESVLASLGKK